jgi:hypothetical protein
MARLYAKCTVPSTHLAGKLGWTLTYQDPNEKHYERFSYTDQSNITTASLTVYSSSSQIPGVSTHFNISTASSFQYINSSKGYSFATQSGLALFNNINTVDTRIDNIYNGSLNKNEATAINDSNIYVSLESSVTNINVSHIKNRQYAIVANNSKKVAIGNDSDIYSVCFFERPGLFPAGIYVLDIQRFSPDTGVPLKTNRNVWIIKTAQKELTCGTYLDIYNEINLT